MVISMLYQGEHEFAIINKSHMTSVVIAKNTKFAHLGPEGFAVIPALRAFFRCNMVIFAIMHHIMKKRCQNIP